MLTIFLHGGLSQLESWDPKPGAATGGPFRAIPTSFLIFRIYCQTHAHDAELNAALSSVLGDAMDAKTNM